MKRKTKNNKYVFEFTDGSTFTIDGEPTFIRECVDLKYNFPGYFEIEKNDCCVEGYLNKVYII